MLRFTEFDLKTGQILRERDRLTKTEQPKQKQVEHSFLEHWLKMHNISSPELFVAKFYEGVNNSDRCSLELADKVLVYSNGKNGYFADSHTAELLTLGSEALGVKSIYAADRASPHNLVAYGSLVSSDGIASTAISNARILVIDDEARTHGSENLIDRTGFPISPVELSQLYDKMGDGTMLVKPQVMSNLVTLEEREQIARNTFVKAGISSDITAIAQDFPALDGALQDIDRQIAALVNRTVTQFRAATIDLPGMIKGTMATSAWCERLGVDAIISKNDIKGDDGRLSSPGIKAVSDFWCNRKSDGQYGEQAVGPQVKGCIPEATRTELNLHTLQQATELAAISADPRLLLQNYVEQKEKHHERFADETREAEDGESQETEKPKQSDWLYEVAIADRFGMLTDLSKVNRELEKYLKGERVDNAIRGIYVPSAMAQSHAQIRPWEVCNKDLPHGAVVAYYRSPFPNVGAAAIAINNTDIIRQQDPEAYSKNGVAYLPPWTAKNIAITDFDRDANGYFCGYIATVPDLPQQIRAQMEPHEQQTPDKQYEAARALLGTMVEQTVTGQESRLEAARYPVAVKEFIERNAPGCKPLEIVKQKKEKHRWAEGETHSAALWQAWSTTADNPTGKVANVGMTLQSLALETQYIASNQKEALLREISTHYHKLLAKLEYGKFSIPSDEDLAKNQLPAYHFKERMTDIAQANRELVNIKDPMARQVFVEQKLAQVGQMLNELVDGPIAVNLQVAVDTAKSSRGIDVEIHEFAKAIAHKEDLLRQSQKDPKLYTAGKAILTNTQEPIGWGVEQSNHLYQESKLFERGNQQFFDLFPKAYTAKQKEQADTIASTYNQQIKLSFKLEESMGKDRVQLQPTMSVVTEKGKQLTIQRLCEGACNNDATVFQASGKQDDWQIQLERHESKHKHSETVKATLNMREPDGSTQSRLLGFVAPEQVEQYNLASLIRARGAIPIESPTVMVYPPHSIQHDKDDAIAKAVTDRQAAIADIMPAERFAYACAFWHSSEGMGIVFKDFLPELVEQMQSVPKIKIRGLQYDTNEAGVIQDGDYTVRFSQYNYTKNGEEKNVKSVALLIDGEEKQFGSIDDRSMHLPVGTLVQAQIRSDGAIAHLQVTALLESPIPQRKNLSIPTEILSRSPQMSPTSGETTAPKPAQDGSSELYAYGRFATSRAGYEVSSAGDRRFSRPLCSAT